MAAGIPPSKPSQFTALFACKAVHDIKAASLVAEIQKHYPSLVVSDWGAQSGQPAQVGRATALTIDGIDIAVMNVGAPAPAGAFDGGNFRSFHWPNASTELAQHGSHIFVMELAPQADGVNAIARASAVTIVCDAVAAIAPPSG